MLPIANLFKSNAFSISKEILIIPIVGTRSKLVWYMTGIKMLNMRGNM